VRFDSAGLFWTDLPPEPVVRKTKVVEKRQAPVRTWEKPDYLPELQEAKEFKVDLVSDQELINEAMSRGSMFFDIECYVNYFLVCMRSTRTRKVLYFEMYDGVVLDVAKLRWVCRNFCLIGFNSKKYDLPMLQLALAGATCEQLKMASDNIIQNDQAAWQVLAGWAIDPFSYNSIDLIEVCPLMSSLKIYGGRLHCKRMWDLPFPPGATLTSDQRIITRWYCINDLDLTELVAEALSEQLELRKTMGVEYGLDLRSLSDAQIAEAVIIKELEKRGVDAKRASVESGVVYRYKDPGFIKFQSSELQAMYTQLLTLDFTVGDDGYVKMPVELSETVLKIGNSSYQMGMGGLHSQETCTSIKSDGTFTLVDRDVASYYPSIILNSNLYPQHLGESFLSVYRSLVDRRLAAKKAKNRVVADSLKITINGTFGKLGSKWSVIYSPDLLFQVTITGQLGLLMLIEALEAAGAVVVSANTDGVVSAIPLAATFEVNEAVKCWENLTGFETEATEYKGLYSRDVNSYIAVKSKGGCKTKGAFNNPWVDAGSIFRFHKNPVTTVCIEAVCEFLESGISIEEYVHGCNDIRKFIAIRTVKGGAVKDGVFLGKSIRWYYSTLCSGVIMYASNGNAVAETEGAQPCMTLPDSLPSDIDYDWYIEKAKSMLASVGYF